MKAIDLAKKQQSQPQPQPDPNIVILSSSKDQPQPNPNSQPPIPNYNQQTNTYSPGTPPKGTPVPHPTQPRHLTNLDIQKMMETPQPGQQQNNFNPKRYW